MVRQERMWRCIKEHGPIGVKDIAVILEIDARKVSHSLYDLRKRVRLESIGGGCSRRWFVPKGATYKHGGKGSHPNSRKNLSRWDWRKGLAAIHAKRGIRPKCEPTLLDECWRAVVSMKRQQSDGI